MVLTAMLYAACKNKHQPMNNTNFTAQKLMRSATITLPGKIENVFPLFGTFEERKWAHGWNPVLVYPQTEIIEEGTTFKTISHDPDEQEYIWRISKYQPDQHLIQYLVTTPNRWWTITIQCHVISAAETKAVITYSYIGLNATGNQLNAHAIESMYQYNLKDWEEAINYYLEYGEQKALH